MTDDQLTLLFKVALACVIAAFAPQIMRFLRRLGYRSMKEQREIEAREKPPDKV